MKRKTAREYVEDYEPLRSVGELDPLTLQEIVGAMDPEREDPLLNPWKRGYNAAIRSALRH